MKHWTWGSEKGPTRTTMCPRSVLDVDVLVLKNRAWSVYTYQVQWRITTWNITSLEPNNQQLYVIACDSSVQAHIKTETTQTFLLESQHHGEWRRLDDFTIRLERPDAIQSATMDSILGSAAIGACWASPHVHERG